jgi:N-acetylmuramoyl-L-alanine amidase
LWTRVRTTRIQIPAPIERAGLVSALKAQCEALGFRTGAQVKFELGDLPADLLLSIHHDSVPNKFLEDWEFEGKKSHFSDRFSGYSVFVSRSNPDFKTSFAFAELIGKEMKAQGLEYARQYSQAIMGRYQRELLNRETGVYRYDELIVLRKTRMAAVLLEAGSIINRDEELKMSSPERRDIISSGVTAAVKEFCEPRWALLGPL